MSTSLLVLLQWFPFLIGTVRTLGGGGNDEKRGEFPFLIGTVRTFHNCILFRDVSVFPFLIGTVRTFIIPILSIPS